MTQIDYTELRKKIESVSPDEMAEVLSDAGYVRVQFHEELHPGVDFDSLSEIDQLCFRALDTSYQLLREYAVRVTLAGLRELVTEQGGTLLSDGEMFRMSRESGGENAPTGYLDLAPDLRDAALSLHDVFASLADACAQDAEEGLFGGEGE